MLLPASIPGPGSPLPWPFSKQMLLPFSFVVSTFPRPDPLQPGFHAFSMDSALDLGPTAQAGPGTPRNSPETPLSASLSHLNSQILPWISLALGGVINSLNKDAGDSPSSAQSLPVVPPAGAALRLSAFVTGPSADPSPTHILLLDARMPPADILIPPNPQQLHGC